MNTETRQLTYAQAIQEAPAEEMERDERVYLMGEDAGSGATSLGALRPAGEVWPNPGHRHPDLEAGFMGCGSEAQQPAFGRSW